MGYSGACTAFGSLEKINVKSPCTVFGDVGELKSNRIGIFLNLVFFSEYINFTVFGSLGKNWCQIYHCEMEEGRFVMCFHYPYQLWDH